MEMFIALVRWMNYSAVAALIVFIGLAVFSTFYLKRKVKEAESAELNASFIEEDQTMREMEKGALLKG